MATRSSKIAWGAPGGHRGQWNAAARFRRRPSRSQSGLCRSAGVGTCRPRSRDCLSAPASDGDGDRNMIVGRNFIVSPSGQPGGDRRQLPADSGLRRRPLRCRAVDADQLRGRSRRCRTRHRLLRNADRLEVLRLAARRRPRDAVRRGERRHRVEPRARKRRAVGHSLLASISSPCATNRSSRSSARTGVISAATFILGTTTRGLRPTRPRRCLRSCGKSCRRSPER